MRVKVTPEAPYFAICVCAEAFLGLEHVTQRLRVAFLNSSTCGMSGNHFLVWNLRAKFSCMFML